MHFNIFSMLFFIFAVLCLENNAEEINKNTLWPFSAPSIPTSSPFGPITPETAAANAAAKSSAASSAARYAYRASSYGF